MTLPIPAARFEDEPFWTGGADGALLVDRCASCGRWQHPPAPVCRSCGSDEVSPARTSGRAHVFSYTVNHQRWTAALETPYVLAIVALEEDPTVHLTTRLVDVDPDRVRIGTPVAVRFEQAADVWLPLFAPIPEDDS